MANPGSYYYTQRIQLKILALLWLDSNAFSLYQDVIRPKYFTNSIFVDICRILFDYYNRYKIAPTLDVLVEEVADICDQSKQKSQILQDYLNCIEQMATVRLDDADYIKDKILSFGKRQALVDAVYESATILEREPETQYIKIEQLVRNALLVGENANDLGINLFENVEERFLSYATEDDVIERIPTGIEKLDMVLGGGLGRTEMGIVVAAPGRGKTTTLVSIGAAAVEAGYNVLHVSLENNEKQIARNYDVRLLQKNREYIENNVDKALAAMLNIQRYRKGQLRIKKYPTKTATVKTIRALLDKYKTVQKFVPDVLIVDYGAILKSSVSYADKRNAIESNYEELRAVADEYNVALWSAAQGNRGALSKKLVTMSDLAECFAIANIADVMACICQTIREKVKGELRLFLPKIRDSADTMVLAGRIQYDIKKIEMFDIVTEKEEDDEEEQENWESDKRQPVVSVSSVRSATPSLSDNVATTSATSVPN